MRILTLTFLLAISLNSAASSFDSTARDARIVAQWPVDRDGPPLVVLVQNAEVRGQLSFWRQLKADQLELLRLDIGNIPMAVFPTAEQNGYLVTQWATGSAFVTRVFEYDSSLQRPKQVLQIAGKNLPDLIFDAGPAWDFVLTLRDDDLKGGERVRVWKLKHGQAVSSDSSTRPVRMLLRK